MRLKFALKKSACLVEEVRNNYTEKKFRLCMAIGILQMIANDLKRKEN